MKKICFFVTLLLLFAMSSCKDEDYTRYDDPSWTTQYGDYSESMTAVVDLPKSIKPYMTETDEMAVFINDECRGTATIVDGLFYINIQGTSDEVNRLTFRYYSSKNRYLYQGVSDVNFEPNKMLGSTDEPYIPVFVNI